VLFSFFLNVFLVLKNLFFYFTNKIIDFYLILKKTGILLFVCIALKFSLVLRL